MKKPSQVDCVETSVFYVLYCFAGRERRSDMCEAIEKLLEEESGAGEHQYLLTIEDIDTERGGEAHDLTVRARQLVLLKRVEAASFDLVMTTPPCQTHCRDRFANTWGPRPVRDVTWPQGFPWLEAQDRAEVEGVNSLVDFSYELLDKAAQVKQGRTFGFMEHP